MYAAHSGRVKEAKLLVAAKADLTLKDKTGMTAADYASFQCHPEIVELLNTQDKNALIRASEQGKVAEAQRLIGAKVDLNHKDCYGNTALMYAVCRGHTSIVKQLADAGANPNLKDKHHRTALMYAAHSGRIKEAKILVGAKADMSIRDAEGCTALIHAALQKHEDIVRILATADPDTVECGICNEEGGDFAVIAPCHHHYHRHCLDDWKSHDATCPKCRGKIEKYSATIRLPAIAHDEE
jgi:ankyrin repeat protein